MHDVVRPERVRLTYDDFRALPDDGRRYEIIDGDLSMSPSPVTRHQVIVGNLFAILREHVRRHALGRVFIAPFDVVLGNMDVVEPDVIFVSTQRAAIVTDRNIQGVPDLLVEVLSPATAERDRRTKRNLYARAGVPWYWLVDPDANELVELQLVGRDYGERSRVAATGAFSPALFPQLQLSVAELWT
ncbi:MAG: Uma2 family endonuclease [Phycisphaerae bacterium]